MTMHKIITKIGIYMLLLREVEAMERARAKVRGTANAGIVVNGGIHAGNVLTLMTLVKAKVQWQP